VCPALEQLVADAKSAHATAMSIARRNNLSFMLIIS
jgi:hypothetical protein